MITQYGVLVMKRKMCVPKADDVRKAIMEEAHCSTYAMHPGSTKMYQAIKKNYWWSGMKRDITEFMSKCLVCQQVKAEHHGFYRRFTSCSNQPDAILLIVDRLTKFTHFLAICSTFSLDRLARLYIKEIVKLHGVSVTIV